MNKLNLWILTLAFCACMSVLLSCAQSPTSASQPGAPSTMSVPASPPPRESVLPNPPNFPPATIRDVPAPAAVPWPGVPTYIEQTYKITAKIGEEFAIGMFATASQRFLESHDQSFLALVDDQMVKYEDSALNRYGTEWFLFKPLKIGQTTMLFQYPIEYGKLFSVTIQ